jgi:HlyD family secretion protein
VTATGSLQAIKEQKLGFAESGKLVELNVAVGQQVEQGQILARIDDFAARKGLESANAQLAQERAVLARIQGGNQVAAAEEDVRQAEAVLEATRRQADAVDSANSAAIEQAERRLDLDREALDDAESECGGGGRGDEDDNEFIAPASDGGSNCDDEVRAAERQVRASEQELDRAEQQQRVDEAEYELAIENANRDLAARRNEAVAARTDRPHNINEQSAIVAGLRAEADTAQRGVENTVLRAPVAGRIASINGTVGEFVGAGSGTTPLAPDGVPLPDSGSGVSSSDDLGGEGDQPGGSAFIVLSDVNTFRMVAPFAEADVARLQPNQAVKVTFDAVPDLTRNGSVLGISPTGTDIQGVTSYYVAIVLNELDPRLKDGLTASANVVVDKLDNVLVVPNAAVQRSGSTGVVTVMEPDGTQRQVQVELGLAGDSVTQVVSGLREGQQVVVAQSEQ